MFTHLNVDLLVHCFTDLDFMTVMSLELIIIFLIDTVTGMCLYVDFNHVCDYVAKCYVLCYDVLGISLIL